MRIGLSRRRARVLFAGGLCLLALSALLLTLWLSTSDLRHSSVARQNNSDPGILAAANTNIPSTTIASRVSYIPSVVATSTKLQQAVRQPVSSVTPSPQRPVILASSTLMPSASSTEIPTETPGTPTPFPTLALGWGMGCGMPYNSRDIIQSSCWRGNMGGKIIGLTAGREGFNWDASPNDSDYYTGPARGALWVSVYTPTLGTYSEEVYDTPQWVGEVGLVSINGTEVTLKPVLDQAPRITFVFDLASREWIAPTSQEMKQWKFMPVPCGDPYHRDGGIQYTDCWVGVGGGGVETFRILVPDSGGDPIQAIVNLTGGIFFIRDDATLSSRGDYRTPLKVGAVHVTSVQGGIFNIASADGKTKFSFDAAKRQWVPPSTNPKPVLKTGWVDCNQFYDVSSWGAEYYTCWQGTVKGSTFRIYSGRETAVVGATPLPGSLTSNKWSDVDCCVGLLSLATVDSNGNIGSGSTYSTTEKTGALYIVSIDGTRVKVASYDPLLKNTTLTFDIATRQWVR